MHSANPVSDLRSSRAPARASGLWFTFLTAAFVLVPAVEGQSVPQDLSGLSGEELYLASCANCHGADGTGVSASLLAFEEEMPDFTDCDFAVREPDADWIAVAHEGGPVRGFSRMMPAFGGALTPEQLQEVMTHIRTQCTDPNWPPGELNLPRGLVTEKAYPEDEWVVEAGADIEGDGSASSAFVYERRFGPRSQIEVKIPFGWSGSPSGNWTSGLGDAVLGVKHTVYHSGAAGRIFSVAGEVILPTGDEAAGFGAPGTKVEGFASFGQILPADAFLQIQTGIEAPLYDAGENEAFGRFGLGFTRTEGPWGRAWSPMVEVQAKRDLESGATTRLDIIPQMQFSLNTRQHVLANIGLLIPATQTSGRSTRLLIYVLLDWFDGGFFEGW